MFWKWKEVAVTQDLRRYNQMRDALRAAGIDCRSRVANRMALSAGRSGALAGRAGERPDLTSTYSIYVRSEDLERVVHLLRKSVPARR